MSGRLRGYTLIELCVTLGIVFILLNLGLPSYSALLARQQSQVEVERLNRAISIARHTAVNEGRMTTLCRSSDGFQCGGQWQQGYIVFTDHNGDRQINGTDRLVEVFPALSRGVSLRYRAFQNKQYLQMTPAGFTNYQNGNFTFCPDSKDPALAQQLIVNRAGRTYLARDLDGDGIREGANGKPISCD